MTDKVPTPTGETYRDEVGADGCGCPITAEHTANGSEVDGSSWTEHRANCWEIKTESEPTGYAATAAALRRIADALDTLPPVDKLPWVTLSILPDSAEDVDMVALAVLGERGQTEKVGGIWHHIVRRDGPVHMSIHAIVPGPPDPKDVEIERLKAENARMLAEHRRLMGGMYAPEGWGDTAAAQRLRTGYDFSREADDPEPGVVPNGVEGSTVTGRATVLACTCPLGPEDAHFPDCPMVTIVRDPLVSGAWAGAETRGDVRAMKSMVEEAHVAANAQNSRPDPAATPPAAGS